MVFPCRLDQYGDAALVEVGTDVHISPLMVCFFFLGLINVHESISFLVTYF